VPYVDKFALISPYAHFQLQHFHFTQFNMFSMFFFRFEKMRPLLVSWAIVLVSVCSYKRDAMTSKMSNGGATDVYLSNSRCVRDNHTSVDNNVFTGRLPVSTGPQHHQWPQQQHQLLMQADDNTQLFADNGHCAWVKLILVKILSLQFISWLKGINHMSTWLLFVLLVQCFCHMCV